MNENTFTTPELRTDRLHLRAFRNEDFGFIRAHFGSEQVNRYLYDREPPRTDEEVQEVLDWCMNPDPKDHIRWGIELKDNPGTPIGTCGLHAFEKDTAETGFDLNEQYWRKGYMSEALKQIFRYGFQTLDLTTITAVVYSGNEGSNELLKKLGFQLQSIKKEKHLFRGEYYEHKVYALSKDSFNS